MVNWWLVAWISAIPIGILSGTESQTTGPQITNSALVELHSPVFCVERRLGGFDQTSWKAGVVAVVPPGAACGREWCILWLQGGGAKGIVGMVEKVH